MRILSGEQEPSGVTFQLSRTVGKLRQDQFAYEQYSVVDTVIMGHEELWQKAERDRIYSLPEMSEEEGMRLQIRVAFAEMDGYTESRRRITLGGDSFEAHFGLMSELAPGLKLRVLLAQVLFSEPDIMLLDEPTNNLDINTIRWLENVERTTTMIIISHDRISEQRHAHGRYRLRRTTRLSGQLRPHVRRHPSARTAAQ